MTSCPEDHRMTSPELPRKVVPAGAAAFADVSPERSLKVLAYQMPTLS